MSGPSKVEELIDEQEIQDVIGRLARAQDRLDRPAIIDCYHPDAEDDHNAFKGNREEFADWVIDLLGGMFEATNHFVGPSLVELDGDVAQVNTVCLCHHLSRDPETVVPPGYSPSRYDMWAGIRYLDRFERRDGEWRIARRTTPYDWGYCAPFSGDIRGFEQAGEVVPSRDRNDPSYKEI